MTHLHRLRRLGLFDAKVPRFTSFPPANRFSDAIGPGDVAGWLKKVPQGAPLSLYVHIPFCKRLCWFCACRTQGTRTGAMLGDYVERLLREAQHLRAHLPGQVIPRRLHFGGGTPTILEAPLLGRLISGLDRIWSLGGLEEFSVEVDPTDVGPARLDALVAGGMNRASLGIQDFNPVVQQAIGRKQGFARTRDVTALLRDRGVSALNFDLLYGLPFQTRDSLSRTLDMALSLEPERIALFGYAHVPWMSKRQVMIPADALPAPEERWQLFEMARKTLEGAGFVQIGIDHFARPGDGLARALRARQLHRSFQGYTDDATEHLLALGASGISRVPQGYFQNNPQTGQYARAIDAGTLPVWRGYAMSGADKARSKLVEDLMCYFEAPVPEPMRPSCDQLARPSAGWSETLDWDGQRLRLHDWARPLVRIIASELVQTGSSDTKYSRAI